MQDRRSDCRQNGLAVDKGEYELIEIKVNDEIRDVRAEFLMGLNLHQIIWCSIGLVLTGTGGILIYLFTPLPLVVITYLCVFLMLPFGAMAFLTWHEMDGLEAAKLYVVRNLIDPVIKTYGSSNQAFLEYQERIRQQEKEGKKQKKRKKGKTDDVNFPILEETGGGKGFCNTKEEGEEDTYVN